MARLTKWTGFSITTNAIVVGTKTKQEVILDTDDMQSRGCTITRIRGMASVMSSTVSALPMRAAAGLIQVQSGSLAAAMPDPASDHDADWIWLQHFTLWGSGNTAAAVVASHVIIDNMAQRRCYDHKALVLVWQNLGPTQELDAVAACRILYKLP